MLDRDVIDALYKWRAFRQDGYEMRLTVWAEEGPGMIIEIHRQDKLVNNWPGRTIEECIVKAAEFAEKDQAKRAIAATSPTPPGPTP